MYLNIDFVRILYVFCAKFLSGLITVRPTEAADF